MEKHLLAKKLRVLIEKVNKIALRDGIITDDEEALIKVTEQRVNEILDLLKKSNTTIDERTRKMIDNIIKKMEDETISVAEFDDLISEDEVAILGLLFKQIDNL